MSLVLFLLNTGRGAPDSRLLIHVIDPYHAAAILDLKRGLARL